jgi:hypothetical protein
MKMVMAGVKKKGVHWKTFVKLNKKYTFIEGLIAAKFVDMFKGRFSP